MSTTSTTVAVRVIARDGKFLGDDIGGAHIVLRDALTKELLAQGYTAGGSGQNGTGGVMCVALKRGDPLPTNDASVFLAQLTLDRPRRIEITAFGPLGALGSANTVSATQWVYPGLSIEQGNGFLLEMPGLIVQIIDPVTHYAPSLIPSFFTIRANVAMMCGCPISNKPDNAICPGPGKSQPWPVDDFAVSASIVYIPNGGKAQNAISVPLTFNPAFGTAGQFVGTFGSPTVPSPLPLGSYQITVYGFQPKNGNTGVDTAVVFLN